MVSHKLSQTYKHFPCSNLSLFVVIYETRYDQRNYIWYFKPSIIDISTLIFYTKSDNVAVISVEFTMY